MKLSIVEKKNILKKMGFTFEECGDGGITYWFKSFDINGYGTCIEIKTNFNFEKLLSDIFESGFRCGESCARDKIQKAIGIEP